MITRAIAAAALAAAVISSPAAADPPQDGNSFLEHCRNIVDFAESKNIRKAFWGVACVRYARGFADGLTFSEAVIHADNPAVCIPQEVQAQQLVDVTVKYLRETPSIRHRPVAQAMALAFANTWPCGDAHLRSNTR
jgi:hypothetical protein